MREGGYLVHRKVGSTSAKRPAAHTPSVLPVQFQQRTKAKVERDLMEGEITHVAPSRIITCSLQLVLVVDVSTAPREGVPVVSARQAHRVGNTCESMGIVTAGRYATKDPGMWHVKKR